jgi:hypothetical protein
MNYAPEGKPSPVCRPGDFPFAATHLAHGHIYGQCNGLVEAGADLRWVYDPDESKVEAFRSKFPQAKPAASFEQILDDASIKLGRGSGRAQRARSARMSRYGLRKRLFHR